MLQKFVDNLIVLCQPWRVGSRKLPDTPVRWWATAYLLDINSAVVDYMDLYFNPTNIESVYPRTDLLTRYLSHILVSSFNVTSSVCLAALLQGTQIAFVESKAKSFTLSPANPEWEERR